MQEELPGDCSRIETPNLHQSRKRGINCWSSDRSAECVHMLETGFS